MSAGGIPNASRSLEQDAKMRLGCLKVFEERIGGTKIRAADEKYS